MRYLFGDTGSPSDASVIFEEPHSNNMSSSRVAQGAAFEIPESLWPLIQGRKITYKDFSELSPLDQLQALRVCLFK